MDGCRFLTYNKHFAECSSKIFEDLRCNSVKQARATKPLNEFDRLKISISVVLMMVKNGSIIRKLLSNAIDQSCVWQKMLLKISGGNSGYD